jgi:hypothetical protein
MHYLSSVYFVIQPLNVSGIILAHHHGGILYIYNNWYVLCFLVDCLLAGQQTVDWLLVVSKQRNTRIIK